MEIAFYIAGIVAIISTMMTITRLNAIHALLYLVVSLLAVAVVFYILGAPFVAALELIIYAGAIMVLFVFAVMLLNTGESDIVRERLLLSSEAWLGPSILSSVLMAEVGWLLFQEPPMGAFPAAIEPKQVGIALFGPYLIGVELASLLLLAGLVGASHLGRHDTRAGETEEAENADTRARRPAAGGDLVRAGADRVTSAP
ncbi:MAG: NADH-quinone oxidoreductase subunit J [Bryobacteraceae bacterium]|nr:NADH-quinone oxidoreductase subunit J [Bryobacteraceae bacterium]